MEIPPYPPEDPEPVAEGAPAVPWPQLTPRERLVADGLVRGSSNREIADLLDISIKTVDTFRGNLLRKLGARNNVELTHMAIFKGYIDVMSVEPLQATQKTRPVCEACGVRWTKAHRCPKPVS